MFPNLKAEMARQGMTQSRLAELTGRNVGYVNEKLTGKRGVSLDFAQAVKKALKTEMPIEELFLRKDEI